MKHSNLTLMNMVTVFLFVIAGAVTLIQHQAKVSRLKERTESLKRGVFSLTMTVFPSCKHVYNYKEFKSITDPANLSLVIGQEGAGNKFCVFCGEKEFLR